MQELLVNIILLLQLALGQSHPLPQDNAPILDTSQIILDETPSPEKSSHENWWLNSGGQVFLGENSIQTLFGESEIGTRWHQYYKKTSPLDTDQGLHPQNLFRLVSKDVMIGGSQSGTITIQRYHESESQNRNQSNGVFFMNRYLDGDNLYYIGLRVDGNAVIKRKRNGFYTTLVQKKIFEGNYDRDKFPNILPLQTPIAVRGSVQNNDENVELKLELEKNGIWEEVIKTVDSSGDKIVEPGRYGIRSDFMDVKITNYNREIVK